MKLKELQSWLSQCEEFEHPKIALEQYATSAHVASRMLYSAQEYINGSLVCDLGSGCGILSIGSLLLDAQFVYGFEIDADAIDIAMSNSQEVIDDSIQPQLEFIQCKIDTSESQENDVLCTFQNLFDVVIMNPPFGTKSNVGADFGFLRKALDLVRPGGHIFSLHKTTTRPYFQKKLGAFLCEPDCSLSGKVLAEIKYEIPKCYKFHKEKSVDIAVDFWHFEKKKN